MNRPVSRRNEAAWREEVRRLARIQEGAKLERERPVEWAAFVALLARLDERHVQADFQFLRNHAASIMH